MPAYDEYNDEDLIRQLRRASRKDATRMRNALFSRLYPRIASWCLALCRDRDLAADLTQDVVERIDRNLDRFHLESRFTTWAYTVTRRTANFIPHWLLVNTSSAASNCR